MFYSVETKRLLIWKCQRHYLIITRIITSKWDNFSKSDKNLSTFVSTLANFWKFFVRNTSSALYHFSYFSRIDYFKCTNCTYVGTYLRIFRIQEKSDFFSSCIFKSTKFLHNTDLSFAAYFVIHIPSKEIDKQLWIMKYCWI